MVENVTQIKSGITVNANVNAKIQENILCAEKITFGILVHVFLKMKKKYYWYCSNYMGSNYEGEKNFQQVLTLKR